MCTYMRTVILCTLVHITGQLQPIEVSILVTARCEHGGASAR
jgi:hypothetical protein